MSGSYYPTQPVFPFLNVSKSSAGVFTWNLQSLTTTGGALPNENRKEIDVDGMQQVIMLVRYHLGTGETNNVCSAKVEFSPDGTNYFQEATESASSGTVTEYQATRQFTGASAAADYYFRIAIPVADAMKVRVQFNESGVATVSGAIGVLAVTSGQ